MATPKQIEANRLNSRKSTGPRSVEGKAASSMNALKTGIDAASHVIRGEDPRSLEALTAEYHNEYQPSTPQMRALVDSLIASEWLLRRLNKVEAQLWEHLYQSEAEHEWFDRKNPLGDIFSSSASAFSRLQRRIDSAGRAWQRAWQALERLRVQPDPPPAPPPQSDVTVPAPTHREIGFVPQPSPQAFRPPLAAATACVDSTHSSATALHHAAPWCTLARSSGGELVPIAAGE